MTELVLATLSELETELHGRQARNKSERLDELLHDDFVEVGRSGKKYSKADIVRQLTAEEETSLVLESSDFEVRLLAANVALLTYKTATINEKGARHRQALRSSVWINVNDCWQLTYHQGTAIG